jgi:hypothetical protein
MPAKTSRQFNLASATMAFALWGGWAYYVNHRAADETGHSSPVTSGLTQGIGSFVITLLMVRAVTWLYHRLPLNPARNILPAIATVAVTGSCLATAHALVGTPNIAQTIAPALFVAFVFNVYTAARLKREDERSESHPSDQTGTSS